MTWTKIGAEFLRKPELVEVSRSARLLHIEATSYSNQHGTDGAIRRKTLPAFTDDPEPAERAAELVESGLWTETDVGWHLVDFADEQPKAVDVARQRRLAAERQRVRRQHLSGDHADCGPACQYRRDVTRDGARDSRVTHSAHTDRPDSADRTDRAAPTSREGRAQGGEGVGGRRTGPSAGAPGRPRRLPTKTRTETRRTA